MEYNHDVVQRSDSLVIFLNRKDKETSNEIQVDI